MQGGLLPPSMGDITTNKHSGKQHEDPKLGELSEKFKYREDVKLSGDKKLYNILMNMTTAEYNNLVDAIPKDSKLPF